MSERWRRIKEVHQEALARDAESRAAYLDKACGQDDALRREVEELLQFDAQAEANGFLKQPALPAAQELQNAFSAEVHAAKSRRAPW